MARNGLLNPPPVGHPLCKGGRAKRGFGLPPAPLKRGTRKATRNLGPVGQRPVGRPPLEGVPEGRGSQKTPAGKILNP